MDVPVVAAAGLEGDVGDGHTSGGQRGVVALADEVLRESVVRLPEREDLVESPVRHVLSFLCVSAPPGAVFL
jgi:hypothetical protein